MTQTIDLMYFTSVINTCLLKNNLQPLNENGLSSASQNRET